MLVSMSKCPGSGVVCGLGMEPKAIIGLLNGSKEKDPGFCYHCTISGDGKIVNFLACLWSSQIKKLSYYSDLVFIDSTFNVTSDGYKGLNLVIVDQHLRALLEPLHLPSVRQLRCMTLSWSLLESMFPSRGFHSA